MEKDVNGHDLKPGDHVYVTGVILGFNEDGSVQLGLDHASHNERQQFGVAEEKWKERPMTEKDKPCPRPPAGTQTATIPCPGCVEFNRRPAPDAPIFCDGGVDPTAR